MKGSRTLSFCLVSSEMLPLGERSVGVGGVTVISGGNLVTVQGMKSFGMLGGIRERILLGSGSFGCSLLVNCCCWSEEKQTGSLALAPLPGGAADWELLTWARLSGATRG